MPANVIEIGMICDKCKSINNGCFIDELNDARLDGNELKCPLWDYYAEHEDDDYEINEEGHRQLTLENCVKMELIETPSFRPALELLVEIYGDFTTINGLINDEWDMGIGGELLGRMGNNIHSLIRRLNELDSKINYPKVD